MLYPQWQVDQVPENHSAGLSILDLANSGTIDCKLAGLLWLIMEHRASVLVAAGPSYAGKTTLLQTLLDFLPPDLRRVPLQGYYEDFQFLDYATPQKTYLVAEEISNHGMFEYLWGQQAIRTFNLLSQGYALGSTIHARNSQEVLYILHKYLGLPMAVLSQLGIVVNLRATAGAGYYDEPVRRVSSVDLILSSAEGLVIQTLAARKFTESGFDYLPEKSLQQSLSARGLSGKGGVNTEIDTRMRFLRYLLKKGELSRKEVRKAVHEYYKTRNQ